jgi:hypothetical protein
VTLGATPWYITALQYGSALLQMFFWIAIPTVLFLAWRDFRRLVDYYVLEEVEYIEEEVVTAPKYASEKKAKKAKKEGE